MDTNYVEKSSASKTLEKSSTHSNFVFVAVNFCTFLSTMCVFFYGVGKGRSTSTQVQSDPDLHSPVIFITPPKNRMFLEVYWNQPVCPSVCVQYTSVYQSAGRGIQSHLVTALVSFWQRKSDPMPFNK